MKRNNDGVVRASGSWSHQMAYAGVRWKNGEPFLRQFQSWGPKSCSGPDPGITHPAISGCSWWTAPDDADRQLKQSDSFAFAGIQGFELLNLDWAKVIDASNWIV
jgi:hypothetical protein